MMPVTQIIQHQIAGWLVNDELEGMWKETVIAQHEATVNHLGIPSLQQLIFLLSHSIQMGNIRTADSTVSAA
jgi:hypothetical protein